MIHQDGAANKPATVARTTTGNLSAAAIVKQNAVAIATCQAVLLVLHADGRIARLNPHGCELTGFTPQEILGRPIWSAILIPEEVASLREALEGTRAGKRITSVTTYVLTKHGERRRVAWNWTALRTESGEVECYVGAGIDITAHSELQQDYQRLQEIAAADRLDLVRLRQQLHQSLDKEEETLADERRSEPRRSYPYEQAVAPIVAGRRPADEEFQPVLCHELSSRGCSYLVASPPDYQELVITFGVPPTVTRLLAEVRHFTPLNRGNQAMYLVGCRFKGRVS